MVLPLIQHPGRRPHGPPAVSGGGSTTFTRVFHDNFEDGTTNKWTQDSYHNKIQAVTSSHDGLFGPHSGTYMAEGNWDGTVVWNDPAAYSSMYLGSWPYTTEFLVRAWVRADSDVDHMFGSKWWRLFNDPVNDFFWDGQMEQTNQPAYVDIGTLDGVAVNYNDYGGGIIGDTNWHKFEVYIKQNNSGGAIFRFWNDGVLTYEKTGISSDPANKWYPMYILSNWSNNGPEWVHDANNHTYWNEFEIFSDDHTGDPTTGSLSDASIAVA